MHLGTKECRKGQDWMDLARSGSMLFWAIFKGSAWHWSKASFMPALWSGLEPVPKLWCGSTHSVAPQYVSPRTTLRLPKTGRRHHYANAVQILLNKYYTKLCKYLLAPNTLLPLSPVFEIWSQLKYLKLKSRGGNLDSIYWISSLD